MSEVKVPDGHELSIDDRELETVGISEPVLVEGRNGKMREQTDVEWGREYIRDYGEEEYVKFLLDEKLENPKGIKIKDEELAKKLIEAGLQK